MDICKQPREPFATKLYGNGNVTSSQTSRAIFSLKKKKENKKPHTCGSGVKHTANENNKTVLFPIIFRLGHILLIKVRLKVFCVTESLHIQLHVYDQRAEYENATVVISSRRRLEF